MTDIQLNLVVIGASNLERTTAFYRLLGLDFVKHRHGKGLEHFACDMVDAIEGITSLKPQ